MFWNFLLICAFLGIVWFLLGKGWEKISDLLENPVSFLIPGLGLGVVLTGIMFAAELFGFSGDIYIFGFHPFWVGFVPMTVREIYRAVRLA